MRGNSMISLQAHGAWLTVHASPGIGPEIVHGCVDWYLYDEAALAACSRAESALEAEQAPAIAVGAKQSIAPLR